MQQLMSNFDKKDEIAKLIRENIRIRWIWMIRYSIRRKYEKI